MPNKYGLPDPALDLALTTHKPMIEVQDFIVESFLLCHMRNNEDTKVLEIGSGNAGWVKALHDMGYKNPEWYLVENFSWAKDKDFERDWATDAAELESQILEHDSKINIKSITSELPENDVVYDVIRIDCEMDPDKIEEFIENHTHYASWVMIDDCRMDCGFERLALAFRLMYAGFLSPVWIGEKECIFSRNKNDGEAAVKLLSYLPEQHIDMYHREESYHITDRVMVYAVTTKYEIPGDRKLCI